MNNKIKFTIIAAFLIFAGVITSYAQNGRFNANHGRQQHNGYCLDIPGLDEQQKAKIMKINETHQGKIDELRLKKRSAETIEERNEITASMLLQQNEHIKQIKALLTEEQKESLNNTYFGMGPRGMRSAPHYGRGGGGANNKFAPGRRYGRAAGFGRGRGFGGRGLGPCGAGNGPGNRPATDTRNR
ncbi:MAG: hypothetical protein K9J25_11590 [Bacteroidales bacterium]|nr:hypothetical protein [Bacteroidales bacterium]